MKDYDYEDVALVKAGVFAAFCVGRFILMFLLATIHGFRTESKPAKRL